MDLELIQNTIEELEDSEITFDTIHKLASLYIVRDQLLNLQNDAVSPVSHVEKEIDDILPSYIKYKNNKMQYKQGRQSEDSMVRSLNYLCKEIREMIDTLYACTEMNKERKCIRELISYLKEKYL